MGSIHSLKLTVFGPENECLEDDSFLLGYGLFFRGELLVLGSATPTKTLKVPLDDVKIMFSKAYRIWEKRKAYMCFSWGMDFSPHSLLNREAFPQCSGKKIKIVETAWLLLKEAVDGNQQFGSISGAWWHVSSP